MGYIMCSTSEWETNLFHPYLLKCLISLFYKGFLVLWVASNSLIHPHLQIVVCTRRDAQIQQKMSSFFPITKQIVITR